MPQHDAFNDIELSLLQRVQQALQSLYCQGRQSLRMQTCQCSVSVLRIARGMKGELVGMALLQPLPDWNTLKCYSCEPMYTMSLVSPIYLSMHITDCTPVEIFCAARSVCLTPSLPHSCIQLVVCLAVLCLVFPGYHFTCCDAVHCSIH